MEVIFLKEVRLAKNALVSLIREVVNETLRESGSGANHSFFLIRM